MAKGKLHLNMNNGYIALTSSLIISLAIMVVVFSVSTSGFLARANVLDAHYKETSHGAAEACVSVAFLKLAQSAGYAGNEVVAVGTESCRILPIETSGSQKIIKSEAAVQGATTNLKVTVNSSDLSIVSWEELPTL